MEVDDFLFFGTWLVCGVLGYESTHLAIKPSSQGNFVETKSFAKIIGL
jgi:hypothetical protein